MANNDTTNVVRQFFRLIDVDTSNPDGFDRFVIIVITLLAATILAILLRYLVVKTLERIARRKQFRWQEMIFDPRVLKKVVDIVPVVFVYATIPLTFNAGDPLMLVIRKLCVIYIIVIATIFINQILRILFEVFNHRDVLRDKPLKGVLQISQVGLFAVMIIVIISMLVGKSPATLLAGLGASAAILMLIFKDSIMGFVSGVQLSANQMLNKGDWISLPKYGVDGTVIDVTLTTVKVRNFDNTILTIPPYILTNEAFQNWRGMKESGGRRVMRSVNIDIGSIRFCTPQMIEKFRAIRLINSYIDVKEAEIADYNNERGFDDGDFINERRQTNIGVFRAYLKLYIESLGAIDKTMTYMIRYLEPTATGLPVQIYFFSSITEWVAYEGVQADVMDHILAVIQEFELDVFQNPAGSDLKGLWRGSDGGGTTAAN